MTECPVWLSVVINTMPRSNPGKERVYLAFRLQSIIEESPGMNSKQAPGESHPSRHQARPLLPDLLLAHISHLSPVTQAHQLRDGTAHSRLDPPTPTSNQKVILLSLDWAMDEFIEVTDKGSEASKRVTSLKGPFQADVDHAWRLYSWDSLHLLVTSLKSLLPLQW